MVNCSLLVTDLFFLSCTRTSAWSSLDWLPSKLPGLDLELNDTFITAWLVAQTVCLSSEIIKVASFGFIRTLLRAVILGHMDVSSCTAYQQHWGAPIHTNTSHTSRTCTHWRMPHLTFFVTFCSLQLLSNAACAPVKHRGRENGIAFVNITTYSKWAMTKWQTVAMKRSIVQ